MTPQGALLLKAWEAWDARPGAEHTARAMEDVCRIFARGEPVLVLRRYLGMSRRAGRSRSETIEDWEDLLV